MRELRSWVFLVLGLLLASLTGIALYNVALDVGARTAASTSETLTVVAAAGEIDARTVLRADQLTRKEYPRTLVPDGAITNEADAVGQITVAKIPAGAAVVRAQLTRPGTTGRTYSLKEGEVFTAFPVGDALTSGGFVQVGDRIDILATVPTADGKRTQTMVQNLEVIDVVGGGLQARGTTALTFIVDAQTAVILKHLRDAQYIIDLTVRSRAASRPVNTEFVDLDFIFKTYRIRK